MEAAAQPVYRLSLPAMAFSMHLYFFFTIISCPRDYMRDRMKWLRIHLPLAARQSPGSTLPFLIPCLLPVNISFFFFFSVAIEMLGVMILLFPHVQTHTAATFKRCHRSCARRQFKDNQVKQDLDLKTNALTNQSLTECSFELNTDTVMLAASLRQS